MLQAQLLRLRDQLPGLLVEMLQQSVSPLMVRLPPQKVDKQSFPLTWGSMLRKPQ